MNKFVVYSHLDYPGSAQNRKFEIGFDNIWYEIVVDIFKSNLLCLVYVNFIKTSKENELVSKTNRCTFVSVWQLSYIGTFKIVTDTWT